MKYENFLEVIMTQRKMEQQVQKAYKLKIDLLDFVDGYSKITETLLNEIYTKEGYDWYSWFCYESDYGQKDWSKNASYKRDDKGNMVIEHKAGEVRYGATDERGNPICHSFQSLWEYLESNCKLSKND